VSLKDCFSHESSDATSWMNDVECGSMYSLVRTCDSLIRGHDSLIRGRDSFNLHDAIIFNVCWRATYVGIQGYVMSHAQYILTQLFHGCIRT